MEKITFDQLPETVGRLLVKLDTLERLLVQQGNQKPKEEQDQLLTVQQAAEFLNLTVPTIYSKVSRLELPVMKRSKRLYFSRVELMDYLKAGHRKTNYEIEAAADNYLKDLKED